MMLAVDIGNSTISFALLKGKRVLNPLSIEKGEDERIRLKEFSASLAFLRKNQSDNFDEAVVCSVVPPLSEKIIKLIKRELHIPVRLVGRDIQVPLKNNYGHPDSVGQDRLLCAYAACVFYGSPCIVIDFGTAITLDYVSAELSYEGGMIIPGIRLSAKSLYEETALLPSLKEFKMPKNLIGKSTKESILSGIFYGYGEMCDGLIRLVKQAHAKNAKVIITGGYTGLMKHFIYSRIDKIDRNLIFKGMGLLVKNTSREISSVDKNPE